MHLSIPKQPIVKPPQSLEFVATVLTILSIIVLSSAHKSPTMPMRNGHSSKIMPPYFQLVAAYIDASTLSIIVFYFHLSYCKFTVFWPKISPKN